MFLIANPDECGIPCRDALNCRFARLSGRDDQMFVQRGPSVSIRIMVSMPPSAYVPSQSDSFIAAVAGLRALEPPDPNSRLPQPPWTHHAV